MDREALYALLRARKIPFEEVTHPAVWNMEELHALRLPGEERIFFTARKDPHMTTQV